MQSDTLSGQQREAMNKFGRWFEDQSRKQPHFYLGGYAGTGKTTLARHILDTLPENIRNNVVVMAPTGKAADVLRKKGLKTACTIHSVIYNPVSAYQHRIQTLRQILRDGLCADMQERMEVETELGELVQKGPSFQAGDDKFTRGKKLFIVDEFSMVGSRLYADLIALNVPVLALGDPGQLPPVKDSKPPFAPDYVMTEIHRQAQGNPVIALAHQARKTGSVDEGEYGESRVIGPDEYKSEMLLNHDQIICYTNNTRQMINKRYRQLQGHQSAYPVQGEKLVCKYNDKELKIYNGAMYTALRDAKEYDSGIDIAINNGDADIDHVPVYKIPFLEYVQKVPAHLKLSREEMDGMQQFDFGYCITGHSSQGSEWDSVLVIDETAKIRGEEERKQWLYTCITRAAKRVTIYRR